MTRSTLATVAGGFLLAGCAVRPPTGPTVLAVPPEGKALSQFQQEEANCRNYAFNQIGLTPTQAGNQSLAGSAVVGTALGTAAGALLGAAGGSAGTGAAVGAGTGLLAGSAIGASNAQTSSHGLQARYDLAYTQCLASTGNNVQTVGIYGSPYGAPYGYYPAYPAYPYYPYYGRGFYGPGLSLGFGFGRRHYFGGHHFRGHHLHGGGGLRGHGFRGRR
jgi:Glycine-zipper domain